MEGLHADDQLTGHNYDGIQEYDNPLPGWWKFLFWVSIIFAPFYYFYFHAGVEGRTIYGQYDQQMADVFELRFKEIGILEMDRATILDATKKPEYLAVGKALFKTNCVSCHGSDGQGLVGPNLTDDVYKNVHHIEDIAKVIENGAANGAMPAWKNRLSHQNLIVLSAAFVASLRGKSVSGGRPPEGNPIDPWE